MNCPRCGEPLLMLETPLKTSMRGMRVTVTKEARIVHQETRLARCKPKRR